MSALRHLRPIEIVAIVVVGTVIAAYIGFGLMTASNTLGCDFLAYYNAANHWLAGQAIYDLTVSSTGSCGTFQYPPPFVLLALPFSWSSLSAGTWVWIAFLLAAWAGGTAILPVKATTRVIVLLLGAVGWPLIFGVRIGQVTPLLYFVFAFAWRNLERPAWLGASVATGAMLKLQPGLLAVWLLFRRDWRALAAAAVAGAAILAVATLVGLTDWVGLFTLLRSLSNAVDIPVNMAIGATLRSLGLDLELARTIQTINTVVILAVVVLAGLRLPRTAGFLVTVIATQLISPIVWAHYAVLLLLPVAWLLDRRHWWALAIPLVHVWVLLPFVPNWTYAVAFHAALIGVIVVGLREPEAPPAPRPAGPVAIDSAPSSSPAPGPAT